MLHKNVVLKILTIILIILLLFNIVINVHNRRYKLAVCNSASEVSASLVSLKNNLEYAMDNPSSIDIINPVTTHCNRLYISLDRLIMLSGCSFDEGYQWKSIYSAFSDFLIDFLKECQYTDSDIKTIQKVNTAIHDLQIALEKDYGLFYNRKEIEKDFITATEIFFDEIKTIIE